MPKQSNISCLNYYRPLALTPVVTKCFERLVLKRIKSTLPTHLDQHQYTYRTHRSTEDAIATTLHTVLTHIDQKGTYARMLFISSAFNTIVPSRLVAKLFGLGLNSTLCRWIKDFLSNRPQTVKLGTHTVYPPAWPSAQGRHRVMCWALFFIHYAQMTALPPNPQTQ